MMPSKRQLECYSNNRTKACKRVNKRENPKVKMKPKNWVVFKMMPKERDTAADNSFLYLYFYSETNKLMKIHIIAKIFKICPLSEHFDPIFSTGLSLAFFTSFTLIPHVSSHLKQLTENFFIFPSQKLSYFCHLRTHPKISYHRHLLRSICQD